MNSKLSFAIAAILGGSSAGIGHAAPASDAEANSEAIQEITVTAQRRTESMQDVPISMQAFTGQTLQPAQHPDLRRLHQVSAECHDGQQWTRAERSIHARFERGFAAQPRQRIDRPVAERRDLSRQSIGPIAESQSRYLCRGFEPNRGSRGPAGHTVRCGRRGGRHPLHHQRAEDRRDRGQRHRRLRHDRPRRSEFRTSPRC